MCWIWIGGRLTACVDWGSRDEDQQDQQLWQDNWDDDNVEDDFSFQLRYGQTASNNTCS